MYLQPWSLLYCWIHKAASTSWSKIFFQLAREKVKDTNLHEAAAFFKPKKEMLERIFTNSVSFTLFATPLIGLFQLSGINLRLDRRRTGFIPCTLQTSWIFQRPVPTRLKLTWGWSTRRLSTCQGHPFLSLLPTCSVEQFNDHWSPYWLHCHVCEQEFDVVGKFETIQEDTKHIQFFLSFLKKFFKINYFQSWLD